MSESDVENDEKQKKKEDQRCEKNTKSNTTTAISWKRIPPLTFDKGFNLMFLQRPVIELYSSPVAH